MRNRSQQAPIASRPALGLLALLLLGTACGDDPTTGPSSGETLTLDIRVHLLESPESEALTTTLAEDEIDLLLQRVNDVWDQADVRFRLESLIDETARNPETFEAFLRGEVGIGALEEVIPRDRLTGDDWDVFFVRRLGQGTGGIYFSGIPAVLQPEVDPFGVRGLDGALVRILAHELGHSLGLGHVPCPPEGNLMAPNCPGADRTRLETAQIQAARAQAATGEPFRQAGAVTWRR